MAGQFKTLLDISTKKWLKTDPFHHPDYFTTVYRLKSLVAGKCAKSGQMNDVFLMP